MNIKSQYIIFYLFFLLLSCNKTSQNFFIADLGEFQALKNGKEWTASQNFFSYTNSDSTILISINKFNADYELREKINFSNIP